jgi:hypothetical protein
MKRLMSILAAIVLFSGALAVTAYAAKKEAAPTGPTAAQITKGKTDGPAAVTAAGVACTITNAADLGPATTTIDKKKVKLESYEVACSEGTGFLINKYETGGAKAYNCVQVATSYSAAGNKGAVCTLPENADLHAQMQPIVAKTGIKCTVNNQTWIGGSDTSKVNRYEVGCSEGTGYILDVPYEGPPNPPITCLQAENVPYECKFTSKEARVAQVAAIAAGADKTCQVSAARWVGNSPDTHHDFFEVACTGKSGFFLETDKGALVKSVDCIRAESIGGGCKLTDMAQAKVGAAQTYGQVLQAHGIDCTPTESKVQGNDARTNRDAVEFKCANKPFGLLAMIPAPGSTGKFAALDCLSAKAQFAVDCTLTPKPALLAGFKTILTAIDKVCTPTDFLMVGPDDGDGDLVEIKCGPGESGYVLDLPASRAKTIKTLTCEMEGRSGNPCLIAGNK